MENNSYKRYAKRILKQYGKNLKAHEKRSPIVSTWKNYGWKDYKDLVRIVKNGY